MADDVAIRFGAELAGLNKGVADARASISSITPALDQFGDLSARQVGSVVSLFNRLGNAAGVALGPIGTLSIELVRASQHFTEFRHVVDAFGAIGETLFQALTNPLTIAIGVLAGGAALLIGITQQLEGPGLDDILKRHTELVRQLKDAYGDAAKAATSYIEQTKTSLQLANELITEQLQRQLAAQLGAFRVAAQQGAFAFTDAFGVQAGVPPAVTEFLKAIEAGNADVLSFRETIRSIALDSPVGSPIRDLMNFILKQTDAAAQAATALKNELGAAAVIGSIIPVGQSPFGGGGAVDQFGTPIPTAPTAGQRKDAIQSLANQLTPIKPPGFSAIGSAITDLEKETAGIKAQTVALTLGHQAAIAYTAEQKVMAVAAAANVKVTTDQAAAVKKWATELGAATIKMEELKNQQTVLTDIAQRITGAFSDWMSGTDTLTHALLRMTLQLAQAVVEALILDTIMSALGLALPTSGLPAIVGKLVFGGGKAEGGPLDMGKWYTAGEHGPEPIWGGGPGAFAAPGMGGGGIDHDALATAIASKMAPHFRRMAGASSRMANTANDLFSRLR